MPSVSVIVPTYNRGRYIAQAIRSVQAQTFPNIEIIVADDGSTDNTAEIVAAFGDAVTYVPLAHQGQPAATRNGGLRVAKGQFVAFLDSDDLFLPHKLDLQMMAFEKHPEAALVYSNGYFFQDDPRQAVGHVLDGLPTPSGDVLVELLRGNFLAPPVVLVRRTCLDVVGTFDETPGFFAVEDYDLWLRIAAQFPVVYATGDVAAIRRHRQSISRDIATLRTRDLLVLAKLQRTHPQLMREHRAPLNEGCARSHGAIALARLEERQLSSALKHALLALRHGLGTPGFGTYAFGDWIQRRRIRGTGAKS